MYDSQLNGNRYAAPVGHESGPFASAQDAEGQYVISLKDLFEVVKRRSWIILLTAVLCAGLAVGFSLLQTPVYEASIKILVGQERGRTDAPRDDVNSLQQLTRTMAEGVNSRPVAEGVIQELGLQTSPGEVLDNLSAEQVRETQFIQVNYRDPSPERAQQGANTVGDVFSEQISEVSPSASAVTATVWERAETPDEPVEPNPLRNGLAALVLGLGLGMGLAFLLEHLDDSWRSPEEAEQVSGVPTFGIVPEFEAPAGRKTGGY